jgi:hypothetical protein
LCHSCFPQSQQVFPHSGSDLLPYRTSPCDTIGRLIFENTIGESNKPRNNCRPIESVRQKKKTAKLSIVSKGEHRSDQGPFASRFSNEDFIQFSNRLLRLQNVFLRPSELHHLFGLIASDFSVTSLS